VRTGLESSEYFAVGPVVIGELAAQMIEKFHELRRPTIRSAMRSRCLAETKAQQQGHTVIGPHGKLQPRVVYEMCSCGRYSLY
jgi:UDP-N-acetylmuramate-alanine ligase